MRKRLLVLLANAILYGALISYGNHQKKEYWDMIKAAEAGGVSFDLKSWTPWPPQVLMAFSRFVVLIGLCGFLLNAGTGYAFAHSPESFTVSWASQR